MAGSYRRLLRNLRLMAEGKDTGIHPEFLALRADARRRAASEPDHIEPATFGWTASGCRARAAVREFSRLDPDEVQP